MTRPDRFSAAFQSASGAAILAALISSMFVGLTGQVIFAVIGCAVGYAAYKRPYVAKAPSREVER